MKRQCFLLTFALVSAWGSISNGYSAETDAGFFFKDGDRAMILGDSITEGKEYATYVETFVLSRFPQWKISFRNTGWSGDTMGLRTRKGLEKGFARDLEPLQPTAVTIDFGMNDARAKEAGYPAYVENTKKLVAKFRGIGTRVALITPSPEEKFEEGQPAGSAYNTLLRMYSKGLEEVAKAENLVFVNQLEPMISVIEKGREAGVFPKAAGGLRLVPDGVHPNQPGHLVMATEILKGLGAPAVVSEVELDGTSGVAKGTGAKVSGISIGEVISFRREDEKMPWPLPVNALPVTAVPGFTPFDDLARYTLKVTSLLRPKYQVKVDNLDFGVYTKEELAAGVNLGKEAVKLPEVQALLQAVYAKNNIYRTLWREVKVFEFPNWVPEASVAEFRDKRIKELEVELAAAEAKVDELRVPKDHAWTLTPVE